MQAVISNKVKLIINNADLGKKFPKEVIPYLLKAVENADAKTRNDIENQLVKIGESGISYLIKELKTSKGCVRALIAMVLIRIGSLSVKYLENAFANDVNSCWISEYIINEIQGTGYALSEKYQGIMAG